MSGCQNCGHRTHNNERCAGLTDEGDWCACSWPDAGNYVEPDDNQAWARNAIADWFATPREATDGLLDAGGLLVDVIRVLVLHEEI